MKRIAGAVAVLVALAILMWFMLGGEPEGTAAPIKVEAPTPTTPIAFPEAPAAPPAPSSPAAEEKTPAAAEDPPANFLTISGRVAFADGNPVPGVEILGGGGHAVTDDTGHYEMRGLAPGEVEVWFVRAGQRKSVRAGAVGVDFVLDEHLVLLRAVDEDGKPLDKARFTYAGFVGNEDRMGGSGSRNRDGVRIAAASGTRIVYSMSAEGREQVAGEIVLVAPLALHEIHVVLKKLGPPGSLDLRVSDDQGGRLPHCVLEISDASGSALKGFWGDKLELDGGRALVEGIQPGKWTVQVRGAEGAWDTGAFGLAVEKQVLVESGKAAVAEFLLKSGGWVRVTVKDPAGTVLAPKDVRLRDERGKHIAVAFWAPSDDDWHNPPQKPGPATSARPLDPGRYTAEVFRGKGPEDQEVVGTAPVVVRWREISDIEIRIEK